MTNRKIIMGIDTSNYTTSVALMYSDGELIANLKRPLSVKQGERGLRQSDAVFSHIKNIPDIMTEVRELLDGRTPDFVGVSTRPRNVGGSYMPCFLSGVSVAESISASLNIPMYRFSHQCGHIMAALYSSGRCDLVSESFIALHVSGGTTEMLEVTPSGSAFNCKLIGGTKDLNAGQVIDRIGVFLGMPFPAGAHIEECAKSFSGKLPKKKVSRDGTYLNLSGLENQCIKLYDEYKDKSLVCAFLLDYLSRALYEICEELMKERGRLTFVFAGGVMSNSIIKKYLGERLDAYFAEPSLSSDNAVGIAALTREVFNKL